MQKNVSFHGVGKFLKGWMNGPEETHAIDFKKTFTTKILHTDSIEFRTTKFSTDPRINIGSWVGRAAYKFSEYTCSSPFKNNYVIRQLWSLGASEAKVYLPGDPEVLCELGEALVSEAERLEKEGFLRDNEASLSDGEEFGFRRIWRKEYIEANPEFPLRE